MTDSGVITIAKKEFFDHIRSHRFLIMLSILLGIAVVGILNGITDYHSSVSAYNNLQVTSSADWGSDIPDALYQRIKPSILQVFFQMSSLIGIVGGILGIALGFDLVTREKENRSLKILLAHPVYRDELINGKALGGMAAIMAALVITFFVSLSILLIAGIIPEITELPAILVFGAVTLLFIVTCFAFALLMSTICEQSGLALIYSLILFVILGSFIPAIVMSPLVMNQVIGTPPQLPDLMTEFKDDTTDPVVSASESEKPHEHNREAWDEYDRQTQEYGEKQMHVGDLQFLFSPQKNYEKITVFLTNPALTGTYLYPVMSKGWGDTPTNAQDVGVAVVYEKLAVFDFSQTLAMIFGNLIALLIQPFVFFGLAYVSFMRMDVR
ncbi:MAG: ABC transporter permease [Methanomicrobiales archaeon]|nr:ABC transporter permease [Methanomicrobiales archaeon]